MTVHVMRKGTTVNPTVVATLGNAGNNVNFDCPTNPIIHDTDTLTDVDRMFCYISEDDSNNDTFIQQLQGSDSAGTQYLNLERTTGYRIKCFDTVTNSGIRFNSVNSSSNYYVLLNSDNGLTHHFARITQFTTDDVSGDSFEFEPRLGTSIPEDAKFIVFKGDDISETSIVAVSAGILATSITAGSTYRLNKSLICSTPLFYFHNDRLDKNNELDHSKKYFIKYDSSNLSNATVNSFTNNTFITTADYTFAIKDYSRFETTSLLVDNLQTLDDPRNYSSTKQTSNEGLTLANNNFTGYDTSFYHARRDDNNAKSSLNLVGPYRYIHYDFSPEKANEAPFLIDTNVKQSFGGRGGYAEAKMVDVSRSLSSKVSPHDAFRVRHQVHKAAFFEWFALKATVLANVTGRQYTFQIPAGYELGNLLEQADEIKIGNRVLRISTNGIGTLNTTQNTQDITFDSDNRLEIESDFNANSFSLSVGDRIYRRAYSSSKNNLLTTYPLIEGREGEFKVVLVDKNYVSLEATVTATSREQKYIELSFPNSVGRKGSTTYSSLEYVTGNYILEVERFNGTIDQIEIDRNMGQSLLTISGRDNYSKLISATINRNSNFSEDIIYSSYSPHNKLEKCGDLADSSVGNSSFVEFDSLTFTLLLSSISNVPQVGNRLYAKYTNGVVAYIGEVGEIFTPYSNTMVLVTLKHFPLTKASFVTTHNVVEIWRETEKNYILNKALSSDNQLSSFATSLGGNAEKGIIFNSGKTLDGVDLVGSTTSRAGVDSNAIGFHISGPSSVSKEEMFQTRLSDGGTTYETFDTVNTLMDFTVINTSTVDGKTTIELAPYVPVTLGRVDQNDFDTYDTNFLKVGVTSSGSSAFDITANRYIDIIPSSTSTIKAKAKDGEPIYIGAVFVGYSTQVVAYDVIGGTDTWRIFLDRPVTTHESGDEVFVGNTSTIENTQFSGKNTHNLYLVNGEHLHGGKMVTLLNSMFGTSTSAGTAPHIQPTYYNYFRPTTALSGNDSTVLETYVERFGVPLYKINHIEKGKFNRKSPTVASGLYSTGQTEEVSRKSDSNYYDGVSKLQYYGSAYKMNQGRVSTAFKKITARLKETAHPHLPVEERGFHPASGSLFWDYFIFELNHTKSKVLTTHDPTLGGRIKSNYYAKDFLEQFDSKVARLFLFANSDILPYSKLRSDSLLNSNRDLKDYRLLLLNKASEDELSTKHSKYAGAGKSKKFLDSDYQSANILDYDVADVSKLTSFGLMRLTELVFDAQMNQISPEHLPDKKKTMRIFNYHFHTIEPVGAKADGATVTFSLGSNYIITTSANVDLAQNDIICDSDGNMIGEVAAAVSNSTTITLRSLYGGSTSKVINTTSAGGFASGNLHKATKFQTVFRGHGDSKGASKFDSSIHPLISILHGGKFLNATSTAELGDALNHDTASANHHSNLILPMMQGDSGGNAVIVDNNAIAGHSSLLLKQYNKLLRSNVDVTNSNLDHASKEFLRYGMLGVVLDRFDIEGGSVLSESGTVTPPVNNAHLREYTNGTLLNYGFTIRPNFFTNPNGDRRGGTGTGSEVESTTTSDGEGVYMGFKVRIKLPSGSSVDGPAGTTLYKYTLNSSDYPYLDYIKDLTGCYLVSEKGVEHASGTAVTQTVSLDTQQPAINNIAPTSMGYVVTHEIDSGSATKRHILISDFNLPAGYYRVMQPNETCTFEFTPNKIKLNTLSSEYTKMPYKNETYSTMKDYLIKEENSPDRTIGFATSSTIENMGHNEGVLSMYCTVDLDGKVHAGSKEYVVSRSPLRALYQFANLDTKKAELPSAMCISDGNTTYKTSTEIEWLGTGTNDTIGRGLSIIFGKHKETDGVVSVSDTLTITTNSSVRGSKRATIGSVVTIGEETDTLVNNLFEENDIEFTSSYSADYPLIVAPNFKGTDLFSAVNYLLERKNKALIHTNGKFSLLDNDDTAFESKVKITDRNNKLQIYSFSQSDIVFDQYNEVQVFSKDLVGIRKHGKNIKKHGRKVLEVTDNSLSNQSEVDARASKLLRQNLKPTKKVSIELGHESLSQIRPSDIIELELVQEGLKPAQYIVLEMEMSLQGMVKLELGRFTKDLTDRFAEMLIASKKVSSELRDDKSNQVRSSMSDFSEIKIVEKKIVIKNRANNSSNSFNIGFEQTIGFGVALGFGTIGGTTISIVLEEEL